MTPEARELLVDPLGHPRFALEACLGRGGMGAVYRAYDRERETRVALKVLERVTPMGLYRFKHEFRALAGVSHPNLLPLFELASMGTRWFFTMELIDGVDLLTYVRAAGLPPVDPALVSPVPRPEPSDDGARASTVRFPTSSPSEPTTLANEITPLGRPTSVARMWPVVPPVRDPAQVELLRASLVQLCAGLHALHSAGHLHRDVKPSNVLVTREGRLVLLDFGILLTLSEDAHPRERLVVGTPSYMAPEQAAGEPLTAACDWYAVGTILYELLAGRRPYRGSAEAMLQLKRQADPPPLHELNPGAPADLVALCERLMDRRPQARPEGHALVAALGGAARPRRVPTLTPPIEGELPPMIGRAAELATLERAYATASEGTLQTVLLAGTSGAGKTTLIERFLDGVRARGGAVVSGRSYQQESVPYKALDGLMDALVRHIAGLPDEARAELGPTLKTLGVLFPVLRSVVDDEEISHVSDEPADPRERRRRLVPALRELLAAAAARTPLCIHLDDAQWGDADSAALLAEALAPPWDTPLLLVLSFRVEDAKAQFLRTFTRWVGGDVVLELQPLTDGDAVLLARQLLVARGADPAHAERIVGEAGGVPLYVAELAHHAADVAGASAAPGRGLAVRLGFDAMLQRRLEALPDPARTLLEAVALAAQPILQGVAARAAGLATLDPAALVLLRNQRFIRLRRSARGELIEAYHDRVREVVTARLAPEAASALHGRLALALAEASADPETLAHHFECAGDPERAGVHAARAAELAARALAFDRAAALYRRALALGMPHPVERERALLTGLATTLGDAGRRLESATAYRQAAAIAEDGRRRSELLRGAAEQLLSCGYIDEGTALLSELLAEIDEPPRSFSTIGILQYLGRRLQLRLRGTRFTPRAEATIDRDRLHRIDTCWAAGAGLGILNPFQGVDFITRFTLQSLSVGEPRRVARGLASDSLIHAVDASARGTRRWRKCLETTREVAIRFDDPRALGISHLAEAMGLHQRAVFRAAVATADRAVKLFRARCVEANFETHLAELIGLWGLPYLGELAELERRTEPLVREARDRSDVRALVDVQTGVPSLRFLAADDPEAQAIARQEVVDRLPPGYAGSQMLWHVLASETLGLLYVGDGAGAWRCVTAREPELARSHILSAPMVAMEASWWLGCGAVTAAWRAPAGSDERKQYLRRAQVAIRRLGKVPVTVGRAYGRLIAASLAGLAGDEDGAAFALREAIVALESRDCHTHAVAARRRLGELLGAGEGDQLRRQADAWLAAQGVRAPRRFAAMMVPAVQGR